MIIELLLNVTLLVTLSVVLQLLAQRFHRPGLFYQLLAGLLFGLAGIIAMMTPLQFAPGVIYDGRSIILTLAGFIAGPVTAGVAAIVCAAYRLSLGGAGAIVGTLVILKSSAIGTIFYYLRRRDLRWEQPLYLWIIGLIVHSAMLATQLLLPGNIGWSVVRSLGPSIVVLYPVGFMLSALVFLASERRRVLETLLAVQNQVLELIASGAPLEDTLKKLVSEIESYASGTKASLLLLDVDGRHMRHVAAPSLPAEYVAATDGVEAVEGRGSCGTAIARRSQVIVTDIAVDPLWEGYRDVALQHGLRACWSTPIFDDSGNVLGTFALYYSAPARPTVFHRQLIDQAIHVAAIAIVRHRQEQSLRHERDFARQVMDTMGEGLFVTDAQGALTYVNPAFANLVGYSPEEMMGRPSLEFAIYDDPSLPAKVLAARKTGVRSTYEIQFRHRNGRETPVLVSGAPRILNGEYQGSIAVITDLVERKKAEQAMIESELRYRMLVDTLPIAIGIYQDGQLVLTNQAAARLLHASNPVELIGKRLTDIVAPEGWEASRNRIQRMLAGEKDLYPVEDIYIRQDGTRVPVEVNAIPFSFGGRPAIQVLVQDITERTQRRREMEAQTQIAQLLTTPMGIEPLLSQIVEAGVHAIDAAQTGSILMAEPDGSLRVRSVAGFTDPRIMNFQFPVDRGYSMRAYRLRRPLLIPDAVNDPEIAYRGEIEQLSAIKSAMVAPLTVRGEVIGILALDNHDRFEAFDEQSLQVLTNIATTAALIIERARLFEEVNRQALQMAQIMQTAPQGLLLVDSDGRVLMANRVGVRDLNILARAQVGDVLTELGDRSLKDLLIAPPTGPWVEVHAEERIFEVIARPVQGDGAPGQWVILIDDVTRARQMSEQVQLQERLATVGQLAAGIAHDFNNILSIILLHVQLAASSPSLTETDRQRMGIIVQQTQYASDLVRQILDFSRQSILQRQVIDLALLLDELTKWLARIFPEDIAINFVSTDGACPINADPTRIRQAIMNLAINARDAMPKGGALRIVLDRVQLQREQDAPAAGMQVGSWICLSVADSGPGIPSHVLPHIFDPFFTTKEAGKGTGLGLAQVHGIVTQHDGHLLVETKEGEGATFTIYLPETDAGHGSQTSVQTNMPGQGASELILLVEDNSTLRAALADMIESSGYQVISAANGIGALDQIRTRGDEVALVLSDVVMPGLGGVALVQQLRARGWKKPVVLMSGHPLEEELETLQQLDVAAWLLKPCSFMDITRALNESLPRTS